MGPTITTKPSLSKLRRYCADSARTSVAFVNQKYIFKLMPVTNLFVFLFEMSAIGAIIRRYDYCFSAYPVVTMMTTNLILSGVADTVAQSVTAIRRKAAHHDLQSKRLEKFGLEIHELDEKMRLAHYGDGLLPDSDLLPPPFDFERFFRFATWGLIMAPFQFKWFQFLSRAFPISSSAATSPAMKRVAVDQLCFAPLGLAAFYTYMTVAEGGDRKAVHKKLDLAYVPTLKANYIVWPAVQLLNFRIVPLQFQLPFVSTVGILWGTYLSLSNSSAEVEE